LENEKNYERYGLGYKVDHRLMGRHYLIIQ
jgi:hypothetical protein